LQDTLPQAKRHEEREALAVEERFLNESGLEQDSVSVISVSAISVSAIVELITEDNTLKEKNSDVPAYQELKTRFVTQP